MPRRVFTFGASLNETIRQGRGATADLPSVPETYLQDELSESLAAYADRVPELHELLVTLDGAARTAPPAAEAPGVAARRADRAPAPRVALRGLAGSARGYLVAWLQRRTRRPILYLVPHGEA